MDELIEERHKKLKSTKMESLVTVSQERLLSLRKKKIDQYINDKRMLSFNSATKYEILLEDIILSSESKDCFLNEYYSIVIRILIKGLTNNIVNCLKSNDNSLISLSLYIIRRYYTQNLENYSNLCNNEEIADTLIKLLLVDEVKIKFEVLWISINLSSHFVEFSSFLAKDENLMVLFKMLDLPETYLVQHTVMLLSNLIAESIFIRDKILNFNLFLKLFSMIDLYRDSNIVEKILKLISNIYRYKYKNEEENVFKVLSFLERIFKEVHLNERVYTEGISILSKLTHIEEYQSKLLTFIIHSDEILKKILYYVMSVEYEIELNCIVILVNLTLCEIHDVQKLISEGIIDILISKLNFKKHYKIIYYSLRAISNISSGTISQLEYLRTTGTIQKTLSLYRLLDKKMVHDPEEINILREIYYILCNCLTGGCTKITYEILSNNQIEIEEALSKGLEVFKEDSTLIKLITSSIYVLIKDEKEAEMSVKKKFLSKGIIENLRSILSKKNYNYDMMNFIDLLIDDLEGKERFSDSEENFEMNEDEDSYITD